MSERTLHTGMPELESQSGETSVRLKEVFVQHYRWVWRTLRRLGVEPGSADDAAQQTFLVAAARLHSVPPDRERAFLMAVMLRVAANARRSKTRRSEVFEDFASGKSSSAPNPEQLLDLKQRRARLDLWLDQLTLELRAPFVLFELEGLGVSEIAELLELPIGTVKTRLRRARVLFVAFVAESGANHD